MVDIDLAAFTRSFWWGAAGPVVVGAALLVTTWLARSGARPATGVAARPLVEAGALVAIPVLTLGVATVAIAASSVGVQLALSEVGLPFVLVALAALTASGGGRTSTVAVLGGLLLVTGPALIWRPDAYLPFFAAACALFLVPTARGIEWLTAPRRPIPTFRPASGEAVSVAERADADHRARA